MSVRGLAAGQMLARGLAFRLLTVMVDAVDQANAHLRMVVGHKDNVKKFLTVWEEFPQLAIDRFQSLEIQGKRIVGPGRQHVNLRDRQIRRAQTVHG